MKSLILKVILVICLFFYIPNHCKAQNWNDLMQQGKAIAEANATPIFLSCTNLKNVKNASVKLINNYPFNNYFILRFNIEKKSYKLELPIEESGTFIGENDSFKFDLPHLILTSLTDDFEMKFKILGTGNGANIQIPSAPSYDSEQSSTSRTTCSLCKGKGWIKGSKTPTYGSTGTHWCSECSENVNASHSHDSCPSCGGKGYYNKIR